MAEIQTIPVTCSLDSISDAVEKSSSLWFLLTGEEIDSVENRNPETVEAICRSGQTGWISNCSNSFADFTVQALGGKIASLWIRFWNAGSILAPGSSLREAISKSETVPEVFSRLNWSASTEVELIAVDWSDESIPLPELAPVRTREEFSLVEPIIKNLETLLELKQFNHQSLDFTAIRAGFYQWYDALERSHEYSQIAQHQGIHRAADYWHAIMHRREPDDSNSKYWFRYVGEHPVFSELAQLTQNLLGTDGKSWDPFAFVDYCSRCSSGSEEEKIAQKVQAIEMVLLMRQTLLDAQN